MWDRYNDSWDTGARAWHAHDPEADWHLVLEDDAVVCRHLLAGIEKALEHLPAESVLSLYLGERAGARGITGAATKAAQAGVSWVRAERIVWGVAIAAPIASIPDMLAACDGRATPYDTRIASYYLQRRWPAFYTAPSLVDHASVPSLLGHSPGRRALAFIGENASALDFDGSGPVVTARSRRTPKQKEQAVSLLVAKANTVVRHRGKRVVLRKGVTTAEDGADIVREHGNLWEPLGVDYPARGAPVEQATAAPGEKRDLDLPSARKVREWAKANGYDVPDRGKLPTEVVEAYRAAGQERD